MLSIFLEDSLTFQDLIFGMITFSGFNFRYEAVDILNSSLNFSGLDSLYAEVALFLDSLAFSVLACI